jgi:hypothetical protein
MMRCLTLRTLMTLKEAIHVNTNALDEAKPKDHNASWAISSCKEALKDE